MASNILPQAAELLLAMRDPVTGLFSSTTQIIDGRYVSRFDQPAAHRYSTVSLLGLGRYLRSEQAEKDFLEILEAFLSRQAGRLQRPGDIAVLAQVLAEQRHPRRSEVLAELHRPLTDRSIIRQLPVQEVAQALSALAVVADLEPRALPMAEKVRKVLLEDFLGKDHLYPRHDLSLYRSRFISFGAVTYFLRSMYDSGVLLGHPEDLERFDRGSEHLISIQGRQGEWPWFFDRHQGKVMDWYEVYSVHQHAMAFLWLFPALDQGRHGSETAVVRSYEWILGSNQLGQSLVSRNPFLIYRSHRRRESLSGTRRYLRSLLAVARTRSSSLVANDLIEVNPECRSYEMGWLLTVWTGQDRFPGFRLP